MQSLKPRTPEYTENRQAAISRRLHTTRNALPCFFIFIPQNINKM